MKTICLSGDSMCHYADSAIHRNRHPLFIADTSLCWSVKICPAIKICRLGTHISEKFASRYYESLAPVCIFMPAGEIADLSKADERYFIMDSAVCVGDAVDVISSDMYHRLSLSEEELCFSAVTLAADKAVSRLSMISTLKMGDVIIFSDFSIDRNISVGDRLRVSIDGHDSIDIALR